MVIKHKEADKKRSEEDASCKSFRKRTSMRREEEETHDRQADKMCIVKRFDINVQKGKEVVA